MSAAQADILKRWIAEGANYAKHWAFEAPRKEAVPAGGNPVDAFVKAKLEAMKLQPSPRAEAATLCRRLHLDLVGLPPSPADVAEFVQASAKDAKDAATALVEKLMKSPHFGEKWARHWLDAARYSDSNGYEKDLPREQWAWRDWVINAFNQDMPYDQFLIKQLAGDLLPNPTQEQIVATGFLRNSMVNEEGAIVPEQFRMDEMFDRMDCIGKATLGLSVQCAQCHTHKFDPITHDEYFGIFAFFNNAYEAQSFVYTPEQQKQIAQIKTAVLADEDKLKKQRPQWDQEMAAWEASVKAKEIAWTPLTATELGSTIGLNHPTQEPDLSILTQGHPTTKGDIYGVFETHLKGITALRLEALTHRDLPMNGPGRSKHGTWAVSEMVVTYQVPDSDKWEPLKLANVTADFSEPDARLEDEWKADFDKKQKRVRGPVSYLIDGSNDTAWRADRGLGLRNQEGVAVVQFENPLDLPIGTKLKVLLRFHHSGDDQGRHNTILGRCRISTTTAAAPSAQPVDYAAVVAMQTMPEKRTPEQQHALFTAWRKTVKEAKAINDQIAAEWEKQPTALTSVLHLAEREGDNVRATKLLDRGAWDRPKQIVAPHTPAALHAPEKTDKMDRLAFARWLADKRSALTARVAVNRVWQAIFGSGLVETSEDFGTRAAVPEYRELLDWLAVDFMEHGWSQRHLLRTILTSATYQQSSVATPAALERDPRNQLLARGPRFRVDAEVVRDMALGIAGLLTQRSGGAPTYPPVPASVLEYNYVKPPYWKPSQGPERYLRALYLFRKRSMPDPMLSSFDAPSSDFACASRIRTNTALAALTGLNEPIMVEAAQALALRILREGGATDEQRAAHAYRLCVSRGIRAEESKKLLALITSTRGRIADGALNADEIISDSTAKLPAGITASDAAAWTLAARVLLNLDETLTKN